MGRGGRGGGCRRWCRGCGALLGLGWWWYGDWWRVIGDVEDYDDEWSSRGAGVVITRPMMIDDWLLMNERSVTCVDTSRVLREKKEKRKKTRAVVSASGLCWWNWQYYQISNNKRNQSSSSSSLLFARIFFTGFQCDFLVDLDCRACLPVANRLHACVSAFGVVNIRYYVHVFLLFKKWWWAKVKWMDEKKVERSHRHHHHHHHHYSINHHLPHPRRVTQFTTWRITSSWQQQYQDNHHH